MKILAVDSSGLTASCAVVEDEVPVAEYTVSHKKTHSQTLMPMIAEICRMAELEPESLDALAVAGGPGSFTGLRIGAATVKGLAEAWNKPVVSVPTVDALAMNLFGCSDLVVPLMDARRNEAYTGIYSFAGGEFRIIEKQCALPLPSVIEKVNKIGKQAVFLGDGVPVFREQIKELIEVPYYFAPAGSNRQRASWVGVLAMRLFSEGQAVPASELGLQYLRMSQAERERLEGKKK